MTIYSVKNSITSKNEKRFLAVATPCRKTDEAQTRLTCNYSNAPQVCFAHSICT